MVISNPQNKICVFKDAGFVAFSLTGNYNILSIVDQTHLDTVVEDNITNAVLGWTQEVKMTRHIGTDERDFIAALL